MGKQTARQATRQWHGTNTGSVISTDHMVSLFPATVTCRLQDPLLGLIP
jgi:hypothetical protein